jgi:hypothetical protein
MKPCKNLDDRENWIDLVPSFSKIDRGKTFMMIVVIRFSEHKHIYGKEVLGSVLQFEIDVSIFMRKPINNCPWKAPITKTIGNSNKNQREGSKKRKKIKYPIDQSVLESIEVAHLSNPGQSGRFFLNRSSTL